MNNNVIKVMIVTAIIAMLGGILLPIFLPLFRTGAENLKVDAFKSSGNSDLNSTYDTAIELLNYAPLFWVLGMAIVLLIEGIALVTSATRKL